MCVHTIVSGILHEGFYHESMCNPSKTTQPSFWELQNYFASGVGLWTLRVITYFYMYYVYIDIDIEREREIYIYIYTYIYIYIYLSLSLCIYIYTHTHEASFRVRQDCWDSGFWGAAGFGPQSSLICGSAGEAVVVLHGRLLRFCELSKSPAPNAEPLEFLKKSSLQKACAAHQKPIFVSCHY